YTKQLRNHMRAVFLFDLAAGKAHQITDGLSDARFAAFDKDGKYLYFTASTDVGPATGWLDMSSFNRPVTRSVYVVVLDKTLPAPRGRERDEEKGPAAPDGPQGAALDPKEAGRDKGPKGGPDKDAKKKPVKVRIDLEGIDQRILALPIPAHNYTALRAGKAGVLFLLESPAVPRLGVPGGSTLHKFELDKRKLDKWAEGVITFDVSHNGEKLLYRLG